jgi:hypothetical protein
MKANQLVPAPAKRVTRRLGCERGWLRANFVAVRLDETENQVYRLGNPGNVGKKVGQLT